MRTLMRLGLVAAAAVFAQFAHAELTYNIVQAEVVFGNNDTDTLDVDINGGEIDFSANTWPWLVGDGAAADGHNSATITIVYTVESTEAITGLELIFSGQAFNEATLTYREVVQEWDSINGVGSELGSAFGTFDGAGLGGSNTPFTQTDFIDLGGGVLSYQVTKTFTLTNLDDVQTSSFASLHLIEQNAVPEPASMAALAIGALGLLARKRR